MIFKGTNTRWRVYGTNKQEIVDQHGQLIAKTDMSLMIPFDDKVENAKLIASAPELLKIAQITLNWIKTGQEMETDIKNRCEKAINKALS